MHKEQCAGMFPRSDPDTGQHALDGANLLFNTTLEKSSSLATSKEPVNIFNQSPPLLHLELLEIFHLEAFSTDSPSHKNNVVIRQRH